MTKAEQETTIRWDEEEQVYWLGTTSPLTLRAWYRVGFDVRVLGRTQDGEARSWEVKLPVTRRFPWRALLPLAPREPTEAQRAQWAALRGTRPGEKAPSVSAAGSKVSGPAS